MKNISHHFILTAILILGFQSLNSQVRYLDDITSNVDIFPDQVYGQNITVLTGQPVTEDLKMDVYLPSEDTETARPLIIVVHSGDFLPQYFNGSAIGGRKDSIIVNICKNFAKKGYVAAAITYRQGWQPLSPEQDIRTGSLMRAAYRGIQDVRTSIRYFRKTIDAEGNPWGIDPEKIAVLGSGTGGFLSFGASTLDEYEEIYLDKFLDIKINPYIDTSLMGNLYATNNKDLCKANHLGYSSDFKLCVNLAGALGDISWLEGIQTKPNEPAIIGFHTTADKIVPFYDGPVSNPYGEFVVYVDGGRKVIETANELGNNDNLFHLNEEYDFYKDFIDTYKNTNVVTFQQDTLVAGTDHFYPFIFDIQNGPNSSPWNWWDKNSLDAIIMWYKVNVPGGSTLNSDAIHGNSLNSNPNMSRDQGLAYLDTIMNFTIPRACIALELSCVEIVNVEELNPLVVDLNIHPNPVANSMRITTNPDYPIESIYIFDIRGQLVKARTDINHYTYEFDRGELLSGMYLAQLRFKEGVVNRKVIFE